MRYRKQLIEHTLTTKAENETKQTENRSLCVLENSL